MSFWQQLNQLLSEAPGNIVYHLVTLFAIQAILAIALSQWRREQGLRHGRKESDLSKRLTLAALGLLITRIVLLVVALVISGNPDPAVALRVLPPLEQAINSITIVLIVWALLPAFPSMPRLNDVVAVLVLLLAGVMYAFFAQDWAMHVQAGMTYNSSEQSTIWSLFQVLVLIVGTAILLIRRLPGSPLRLFTILALLVAHAMQLWDYPEMYPAATEIPFWIRLGHLVALPMLAVLAYRQTIEKLLAAQLSNRPAPEQMAESLRLARQVINGMVPKQTVQEAVKMISEMTNAAVVGVATLAEDNPEQLDLYSIDPVADQPQHWALKLRDWPAFRLAMEQEEMVKLLPDGLGARQLFDLYQEIGIPPAGALLVLPLQVNELKLGVLLFGGQTELEQWPDDVTYLLPQLADYVARAIHNARLYQKTMEQEFAPAVPITDEATSGRIIALEEERDRALNKIETLSGRLQQTESRLQAAQQQARDLAATVDEFERTLSSSEQVAALEKEVATLRESLIEAEEAMAMAAAAEGELSTEWVTMTISRYSGELEEAQLRIAELEEELASREIDEGNQIVTSLAQELRTPLTSIAGYTDLLLGETMGILGNRQRDFLQRVKANVERMGVLLDQIIQLAATPSRKATVTDIELVDVNEIIETAVSTIITELRKKELRLNLDIAQPLPPVPANREALCQVLIHLLSNASQASTSNSALTVSAHTNMMREVDGNNAVNEARFVHLAVTDSGGGIQPEDRSNVFDPQYRAENPLIAGLGDTGAGLSVAETLISAHGGRMWVESEMGVGSTFSVLLPLGRNSNGHLSHPQDEG